MKKRKKFKRYYLLICFLLLDLVALLLIFRTSNARYESNAVSKTELDIALYALSLNNDFEICLDHMVPRDDPYVYKFTVTNTDSNGALTDVNMYYDLKIITTTNIELEYELYMNQEYLSDDAKNVINEDIIAADSEGTYFRTMTTDRQYFGFEEEETNEYTLLVYFPSKFKDSKYQDLVESIQINIESEQMVDE